MAVAVTGAGLPFEPGRASSATLGCREKAAWQTQFAKEKWIPKQNLGCAFGRREAGRYIHASFSPGCAALFRLEKSKMSNPNDGGEYRDSYQDDSDDREDAAANAWRNADGGPEQSEAVRAKARRYSGEAQIFILEMHPRRALALASAAKALNTTPEALLSTGWLMALEWADEFDMSTGLAEYQVPSSVPELRKLQRYGRGVDWDWLGEEQVFIDDAGHEERFPSAAEPQCLCGHERELWRIVQGTLFGVTDANEWTGTADELLERLKAEARSNDLPMLPKSSPWLAQRLEGIRAFRPESLKCQKQDGRRVWMIRRSG